MSSGVFSTAAAGVATIGASVEFVEPAEGTGDGFLTEDPEEEEVIMYSSREKKELL